MIVITDSSLLQADFLKLLENTKANTLRILFSQGNQIQKLNGDDFETIVYNNSITASKNTQFEGHIIHTGDHAFPDIIAHKYFGIEVKMTTGDKWVSTGNSILETTRVDGVEKIYMFFGKFGGNIDIRYRPYQECLYDIGVTHSPRYKIDMDLTDGHSIFSKMGVTYDDLRNEENPIRKIKDYYRNLLKEGEELWWIDSQTEDKTVSPIIRPFRKLSEEEKANYFIETMIFFPEIFGRSQTKYERPTAYLITKYNSVSSSLRDIFTAGGQVLIEIDRKKIVVPKVFSHLLACAKDIQIKIEQMNDEELKYYWRISTLDTYRINQWKRMIDDQSNRQIDGVTATEIFSWGLR